MVFVYVATGVLAVAVLVAFGVHVVTTGVLMVVDEDVFKVRKMLVRFWIEPAVAYGFGVR